MALYEQAEEEKREICAQATTPGMSVAQVARRYAVDANLIFKWLKDPRFAPEVEGPRQEATFLPIEIEADVAEEPPSIDVPMPYLSAPLSASLVDVTLSDDLVVDPTIECPKHSSVFDGPPEVKDDESALTSDCDLAQAAFRNDHSCFTSSSLSAQSRS